MNHLPSMDSEGRELLVFREATSLTAAPAWRVTRDLQEEWQGDHLSVESKPTISVNLNHLSWTNLGIFRWCFFSSPICTTKRCLPFLLTPFPTSIIFQASRNQLDHPIGSSGHLVISNLRDRFIVMPFNHLQLKHARWKLGSHGSHTTYLGHILGHSNLLSLFNACFWEPHKKMVGSIYSPHKTIYKWYILPIGWLYVTYIPPIKGTDRAGNWIQNSIKFEFKTLAISCWNLPA